MKRIVAAFRERFATWGITLPAEHVAARRRGELRQAGWAIQYLFGRDARGEYLDYYASHRMTDDEHTRLYADGGREALESIASAYFSSEDPEEAQRLEQEYFARNRRVAALLAAKGFGWGSTDEPLPHAGRRPRSRQGTPGRSRRRNE